MATAGRHNNEGLPVLAHRHRRSRTMNTATWARRRQEKTNKVDYIRQGDVKTDVQDTDPPANTQPTPLSRLSDPLAREKPYASRPDGQLPSIGKTVEKPVINADDQKGTGSLPGVNQVDPGKVSNPMPGKNQPKPSLDAAAATLLFPDSQTSTTWTTVTAYQTMTKTLPGPASTTTSTTSSRSGMNPGFSWPTPGISSLSSTLSSAPSLPPQPTFSTFVLFSRSEDLKEQYPTTTSSLSINTPLALVTSSSTLATLSVSTQPTPSNLSSSARTGLTPLSRSLFVLFGVLGAITMLIALAVFYMARRTRKQQEQANSYIQDVPYEASKDAFDYASKPPPSQRRMSADTDMMHGAPPYLTDSERNIVRRAATQDGQPEVHITAPGARLHDAINSFIAKSRRLTYKISP